VSNDTHTGLKDQSIGTPAQTLNESIQQVTIAKLDEGLTGIVRKVTLPLSAASEFIRPQPLTLKISNYPTIGIENANHTPIDLKLLDSCLESFDLVICDAHQYRLNEKSGVDFSLAEYSENLKTMLWRGSIRFKAPRTFKSGYGYQQRQLAWVLLMRRNSSSHSYAAGETFACHLNRITEWHHVGENILSLSYTTRMKRVGVAS